MVVNREESVAVARTVEVPTFITALPCWLFTNTLLPVDVYDTETEPQLSDTDVTPKLT